MYDIICPMRGIIFYDSSIGMARKFFARGGKKTPEDVVKRTAAQINQNQHQR